MKFLKRLFGKGDTRDRGFFMVETLVMIGLFAIIALGFASSAIFGMKMRMRAIHRSVAMEIATDLIEEKSFEDPVALPVGTTTPDCVWQAKPELKFGCTQVVTANPDGSKTITVTVADLNAKVAGSVTSSTILAPWGSI